MTLPNFKEMAAADLSTLLNLNEHADLHMINGQQVIAIIEDDLETKHPLSYAEGVSLSTKKVYLNQSLLPKRPAEGSQMEVDEEWYTVLSSIVSEGLLIISLEANQS